MQKYKKKMNVGKEWGMFSVIAGMTRSRSVAESNVVNPPVERHRLTFHIIANPEKNRE
jgi:hypothetical protein